MTKTHTFDNPLFPGCEISVETEMVDGRETVVAYEVRADDQEIGRLAARHMQDILDVAGFGAMQR